jgi:molecular chaperone DnaK (HSP70)
LEKVNDVVLEQSILGRFLDYGMVEIITGSDIGINIFRYMARPVRFKTEMLNQKEDMTQLETFGTHAGRVLSEEPPTSGDIPELIAELDELRRRGIITEQEFEEKKAELLSRI